MSDLKNNFHVFFYLHLVSYHIPEQSKGFLNTTGS